jgi:hypothetical protein
LGDVVKLELMNTVVQMESSDRRFRDVDDGEQCGKVVAKVFHSGVFFSFCGTFFVVRVVFVCVVVEEGLREFFSTATRRSILA